MNYAEIIFYYTKGQFTISDNNLDYLVWLDSIILQPTKEQIEEWTISYPHDISKDNCKEKAKQLIAKYDFAVLPDRSKDIENINEIIFYRDSLLLLIKNPIENPEFPTPPEVIWKS